MDSPFNNRAPVSAAARRWLPAGLAVLALLLAAWGQRRFTLSPGDPEAGLLCFALAALCLLVARFLSWPPPLAAGDEELLAEATSRVARRRAALTWRWGVTLVGGLLGALLLVMLARLPASLPAEFSPAPYVGAWLVAILLVAGAWLAPGAMPRARLRLGAPRWELVALLAIVLVGGWLRFRALGVAPLAISGDEGSIGLEVQRALAGKIPNPFGLIWGPLPALVAFAYALPARLEPTSIVPLRAVGALFGTLALPALFCFARPLVGRRVALGALLLLATFPMHLHFSRLALPQVWDTFFFSAALAALGRGLFGERAARAPWVLAGLLAGLGQYVYTGSLLLPLLLALGIVLVLLYEPERLDGRWPGVLLMALLFALVAGPLLLYGLRHPAEWLARANQVGIFQSGWLAAESALRGQSQPAILWDQLRRALFGFAFFVEKSEVWGPGTPLAPPLLSAGLFLGLIVSLRRWRSPEVPLLHGWFWGVVVFAGALTLNPPTSNRLVAITPVVCLLAALGWAGVASGLSRLWKPEAQERAATLLFALFVGVTALLGVRAHEQYLAHNRYGGGNALIATLVGRELQARPGMTLVMVGAPRLYGNISPLAFLTPQHQRLDLIEPLAAPPAGLPATGDLRFIVLPERAGEMTWILQAYPQGREQPRGARTGGRRATLLRDHR